MSLFIKRSMALLMAAILALNLVGINTFAEESDNEDTVNATPFEIDDEFSVSEEEGNSTEDNITDKIEENDEPIDSDSDVIVDKLLITGFADLDVAFISVEEKLPMEELGLPEQLPVYINDVDEVVYIDVNWICNDDYENTEYERYIFTPVWDENIYEMSSELESSIPAIEIQFKLLIMSVAMNNSLEVTTDEDSFVFSQGEISGLSDSYIDSLSDEQKNNINLVIPNQIKGMDVTSISDNAFYYTFHKKIENCKFNIVDLSSATSLISIGSHAFDRIYLNNGAILSLPISDASSITSIGAYAFHDCEFSGELILPESLISIGDSAFKLNNTKVSFIGELVIPKNVKTIEDGAFINQAGLESVRFDSKEIKKISDWLFNDCTGLSGVLIIPNNIQTIGNHAFDGTNYNAIYLPKRVDTNNTDFVSERTFGEDNNIKTLIICDKSDYNYIYDKTYRLLKPNLGYEMTINFLTDNGSTFTPITRLYNQPYNLEKNANNEWNITDYKFPKIEGKVWGLDFNTVKPISENEVIEKDTLFLINSYEDPVITFSKNINKVYDGQLATLTVTASHPLAKPYAESSDGDVVFMYTWNWGYIGKNPPYALTGYDENQFSFSDSRAPFEIGCAVRVEAFIRMNGESQLFYVKYYDFDVNIQQAEPIVNPLCSSYTVNINGTLPEIKLSEGDTPGTITWDSGQKIKEGTHEYKWTYRPEKNSVGNYNYKTVKGNTQLFASNGESYIVTSENCTNGSIILDKPYGALKGEDVTITFKPNNGYKLSSAELDTNNILNSLIDNKYTIRNIESNHSVSAKFESMKTEDIEGIINNLPDISDDVITEEVKNDILDAKLHYDAVNGSTGGDITEDAKEKMYEAISKLEQVKTVVAKKDDVSNNIEVTNEVHLLENMETSDAEALKNNKTASLKIELIVDDATIEGEKENALQSVLGDAVVGESFDVSVVKKLTQDGSLITEKVLSELKAPIQIVFEVPANLPTIESGYEREFFIIRLHTSDKGEIIADRLEDEDNQANTISVSSDKFSTYIIVYKDVKKDNGSQGGGSGSYSKTYTVTFDALGGSHIAAIKDIKQGKKITQPASPSRKGYTFTGWFIDAKCTKPFDFTKDTIKADMTLYAGWKKVEETMTYNVIFNTLGGNYIPDQSIEEGQKVLMPTEPSKEGYTFTGWYSDKECSQLWDFNASTINADTVLYAGWQKTEENTNQTIISKPIEEENEVQNDENTNKVPFESEEGIYKIKLIDTVDPSIMWILEASEGQKLVLKDMPEKEGYVFKGYFTDEKCTKPWNEDETIQKDISLYAGWDKIEDNNNLNNDEQNTNKTEEEVPTKDADSTSIFIIILVIAVIIGGIVVILKKKKK